MKTKILSFLMLALLPAFVFSQATLPGHTPIPRLQITTQPAIDTLANDVLVRSSDGGVRRIPKSYFANQDNIDILYVTKAKDSTKLQTVISSMNTGAPFEINEKQSMWVLVYYEGPVPPKNRPGIIYEELYKIIYRGKGTYGFEGTSLTLDNFLLVDRRNVTPASILLDPATQYVFIEDLEELTISEYVNNSDPPYMFQDQEEGYVVIQIGTGDSAINYLFVGDGGTYGVGGEETTDDDFLILSSDANLNIGELERVTEEGKTGWRLKGFPPGTIGERAVDFNYPSLPSQGATGDSSFSVGESNTASGLCSIAGGSGNIASGTVSTAFGLGNISSSYFSVSFGTSNESSGIASFSSGIGNISSGSYSFASGGNSEATGSGAHSFGVFSKATGEYSFSAGYESIASGNASAAIGHNNNAKSYGEVVVGAYALDIDAVNTSYREEQDYAFRVGTGDSITRRDAFQVRKSGEVIAPELTSDKIIDDQSLITKKYFEDNLPGGGGTLDLDAVANNGNVSTVPLVVGYSTLDEDVVKTATSGSVYAAISKTGDGAFVNANGEANIGGDGILLRDAGSSGYVALKPDDVTNNLLFKFPNKTSGTYTLATTEDISGGGSISLTTTGTNGAATYSSGTLNVPRYDSYADTKVSDTITNGVTNVAPSQNAVYDALANMPRTLYKGVEYGSPLTTDGLQIVYSWYFPPNSTKPGDVITIQANITKTGSTNSVPTYYYHNTTNSLTLANLLAQNSNAGGTRGIFLERSFIVQEDDYLDMSSSINNNVTDKAANTAPRSRQQIWDVEVGNYIFFAANPPNGFTDTVTPAWYRVLIE